MLVVVFGPQTRLAKALLSSSSWERETSFLLVARNAGEHEAVTLAQPRAAVHRAWEPDSPLPAEDEAVTIFCCAFGVIHPGTVVPAHDLERVEADCRALGAILRTYAERRVHLVFVSSALALCPRPGREYYAGWKNVAEGLERQMAEGSHVACLSVFYPGRLVEKKEPLKPVSWLHSSYTELAEALVSSARQNRSRIAVFGLDARLWLTMQAVRLAWSGLIGRR